MTAYNIHPLFVHFPIALLVVYSILRLVPLARWMPSVAWKQIERVFLVVGMAGAFVALSTGEVAEHLVQPNRALVETHSLFATASVWIYGLLLAGEVAMVIMQVYASRIERWKPLTQLLKFLVLVFTNRVVAPILAILGLVAIAVTGMLGGIMVYGTSADPLAAPLLRLFGISL